MTRRDRDRGAADALGLVLIAPAVIGLAVLVISLSRRVESDAQLRTAAESAAQAAALERNASDAERAGEAVARAMLTDADSCAAPTVDISYPDARPAPDEPPALVIVTIACAVSNRGVEVVQRHAIENSVTAFAPVDIFRAQG